MFKKIWRKEKTRIDYLLQRKEEREKAKRNKKTKKNENLKIKKLKNRKKQSHKIKHSI